MGKVGKLISPEEIAIANSGKSQTEWIEETIIKKLKRQKSKARSQLG